MPQASSEEITSLTVARGLAASWVVLFHLWSAIVVWLPGATWLEPFATCGYLAVPFFFVLSGYVLGLRYFDTFASGRLAAMPRFLFLRVGRVYPVHVAMLVVILALVARHGFPAYMSKSELVAAFFMVQAWTPVLELGWNYPSWSISAEWFAYLAFPFVVYAVARLARRGLWAVAALGTVAAIATYGVEHPPFEALIRVAPTFVTGVALARLVPPGSRATPATRRASLALVALVVLFAAVLPTRVAAMALVALFVPLVITLAAAGKGAARIWSAKPLVFLGDVSYSLYMAHATALAVYLRALEMAGFPGSHGVAVRLAAIAGAFAFSLGCAAVLYYAVEKPCRQASRRLAARRAPVPGVTAP